MYVFSMAGLKQNTSQKAGQTLGATQFLLSYVNILQMNNSELVDFIIEQGENNPLIEIEHQNFSKNKGADANNYISAKTNKKSDEAEYDVIGNLEDTLESFYQHILKQIETDGFSNTEKLIAVNILELTDESGYLVSSTQDIAINLQLSEKAVEAVLLKMQKFEPSGVFARSLSECLIIQLKDLNLLDKNLQKIVENLNLILNGGIEKLAKTCDITTQKLSEYLKVIKRLNPKPALIFKRDGQNHLYYDVIVENNQDEWIIKLNSESLPKILVNHEYSAQIKKNKLSQKYEIKYLNTQLSQANNLLQALQQRAETMLKVATEIVNLQKDFFEKGLYFFKPLIIKDVAEKIGYHESTVSRAIKNKFMKTPKGVFELKYFFSSKIGENEEEEMSSTVIKQHIKDLVENEKVAKKILSDDDLSERLKDYGINIARRTVAKYREAIKIPSSADRKRLQKSGL